MGNWFNAHRWTAIFAAGMLVVTVLALLLVRAQLQDDRREAQVSHLLEIDHQFSSEPIISYRRDYAEKRLRDEQAPDEEYQLLGFFGSVGMMLKSGYLDADDVYNDYSDDVFPLYADARDMIEHEQKAEPPDYTNFVWLVRTLEAVETKSGGTAAHPSKEDVKAHWESEEKVIAGNSVEVHRPSSSD